MINKVFDNFEKAVADIPDGATIMVGGFAGPGGFPYFLVKALRDKGAKDLTVISNNAGGIGLTLEFDDLKILFENKQVKKVIASFPFSPSPSRPSPAEKQILLKEVELEIVPQGTLAERIRAGGAGIPAFYTPTGVDTVVEEGKERRFFGQKPYLLEKALKADYALIRAFKADTLGNLVYRGTARNFNPIMATAADITIVEVDEIVEPGEIKPEHIHTQEIYIQRIVKSPSTPFGLRRGDGGFQ